MTSFSDILSIIIPFFEKYPLHGNKQLDFDDFKNAANIISSKNHLTAEGIQELSDIKKSMNANRSPVE